MIRERLLEAITAMQSNDEELYEELRAVRKNGDYQQEAQRITTIYQQEDKRVNEVAGPGIVGSSLGEETIVLRVGRPVLAVLHNQAVLEFHDAESLVWKNRLLAVKKQVRSAASAVGRIELKFDATYAWVGTGWLVDKDIIVTNRHVANLFAEKKGDNFIFQQGTCGKTKEASVDFLEEAGLPDELVFKICEIIHIEAPGGADMAFLKIDTDSKKPLANPIPLSTTLPDVSRHVAIIGYPAIDSRIPDYQLMLDIFGDLYDKKRLAPGQITGSSANEIRHDCSTLGGNSGSVLFDLASGEAVGLHFSGRFLENNFAVPATLISERLDQIKAGEIIKPKAFLNEVSNTDPQRPTNIPMQKTENTLSFNLPLQLQVTISLSNGTTVGSLTQTAPNRPDETGEVFITEGNPANYEDRKGFDTNFLGENYPVSLPTFSNEALKKDILTYRFKGKEETELRYRHFSVVMSRNRKQCFFSAVNIDGKTSVPMNRGPWRLDPRISEEAQIMKACYGTSPKFSRGHMTRREDPIWGSDDAAIQGNSDSMHVTNTVPQMQTMNAGVWLALENYALQNARKEDMRISVITGPVFSDHDPIRFGVIIPLSFWKIIIFIHDETKELTATGYQITQEAFLLEEEFVYGHHKTNQVPIAKIEKDTGLKFGLLAGLDPLSKQAESTGGGESVLQTLETLKEVRFI